MTKQQLLDQATALPAISAAAACEYARNQPGLAEAVSSTLLLRPDIEQLIGTGLGLSICRSLTELMGGDISVQSNSGSGSCFNIDLPLEVCDCELEVNRQGAIELPKGWSGAALTILVVDDHDLNRQLTSKLVQKSGHRTVEATSGEEALARWKEGGIDLILMDLEMPEMDGAFTTRLIREAEHEQQQGRHVPIIALTAHALLREKERALEAGMDGYVTKPVLLGDLLLEMKRVLQ